MAAVELVKDGKLLGERGYDGDAVGGERFEQIRRLLDGEPTLRDRKLDEAIHRRLAAVAAVLEAGLAKDLGGGGRCAMIRIERGNVRRVARDAHACAMRMLGVNRVGLVALESIDALQEPQHVVEWAILQH
jgi:hypothetical protein